MMYKKETRRKEKERKTKLRNQINKRFYVMAGLFYGINQRR